MFNSKRCEIILSLCLHSSSSLLRICQKDISLRLKKHHRWPSPNLSTKRQKSHKIHETMLKLNFQVNFYSFYSSSLIGKLESHRPWKLQPHACDKISQGSR